MAHVYDTKGTWSQMNKFAAINYARLKIWNWEATIFFVKLITLNNHIFSSRHFAPLWVLFALEEYLQQFQRGLFATQQATLNVSHRC